MRAFCQQTIFIMVFGFLASGGILASEGGTPTSPASSRNNVKRLGKSLRYLAWMEGDVQSGYEVDRKEAGNRLEKWQGGLPDVKDTDEYLEYLSISDSTDRTDATEKKIKAFLVQNPSDKRALFVLASHFLRLAKIDLANYFYNQLEKDKDFPWKALIYNNRGMLALRDRDRDLAISLFEKAKENDPPLAAPLVNLGALYLHSRSFVDAEEQFRQAMSVDDDFEDAFLGLGASLEGQGKFEEAHKVYSDFASSHTNARSTLYNDALILGNRLLRRQDAAEIMMRYVQSGGKETAKAQELMQGWR